MNFRFIIPSLPCVICALFFGGNPLPATAAVPGRAVSETIEQIYRLAGRTPSRGAARALGTAVSREGAAALEAARRGGIGLADAAAVHGPDVYRLATRVPEAAPVLAARAGDILPLARRYGDDFLRLEARLPGLADDAARIFPRSDDLRRLVALPPDQSRQIVSYAAHATDARAPGRLLRAVERDGAEVLHRLDSKKILALGLSSAMVIGATGGAVSVATAPDVFASAIRTLGLPVSGAAALSVLGLGLVLAAALAIRLGLGRPRTHAASRSGTD